ncbi:hypothetical protein FOZ61_001468 [Perkinsus olseni]|uniref:Uncharacterized protein n=1 Tax=Perkinsus olseni TaxID=32597 RepID=A0A7J6KQE8_PEROL|nr:hypothetical protein FOZ61_001468 [Perkinsus olseni]KAF4649960.1 hypothetical protein FOL46_001332 [Perkinsus olseni]
MFVLEHRLLVLPYYRPTSPLSTRVSDLVPETFVYKAPPKGLVGPHQVNIVQAEDQGFDDFVTIQMLRDGQNASDRVSAIRQALIDKKDKYCKTNDDGLVVRVTVVDIPDETEAPTAVPAQVLVSDVPLQDVNAIRQQRSSLTSSPVGRIAVKSSVLKLYDVLLCLRSTPAVDHSIVTIGGKSGLEEKVYQGNCRKVEIGDTVPRAAEDPAWDRDRCCQCYAVAH